MAKQQMTERDKKWKKRGDAFWSAFLFTKDGKPKSALMIYSFCLSIVFMACYFLLYALALNLMEGLLNKIPDIALTLLQTAAVSAIGMLAALLLHMIFKDKRLMLTTAAWMVVYVIAIVITLLILTHGQEGSGSLIALVLTAAGIPILCCFLLSFYLFKRDWRPQQEIAEEPEWKKYIHRQ